MDPKQNYSAADLSAAPAEVVLSGTTYRMSPLDDEAFGAFERFVRGLILQAARDAAVDAADDEERKMILQAASAAAGEVHIGSPACRAQLRTTEGAVRLAWYSLRRNHPRLTLEDARALLRQPGNLAAAGAALESLMPAGPAAPPPKKTDAVT